MRGGLSLASFYLCWADAFCGQELRTYFVTFSSVDRRRLFQVESRAELMVAMLLRYRSEGRFALHAFVVMPDHVHVLVTPAEEVSLEKAIQFIKGGFSFRLKSKFDVWERGHFDKRVPDRAAYEACVRYIEQNPVKAGLVESAEGFKFSSAGMGIGLDPMPSWMG
jgi:putative transposase